MSPLRRAIVTAIEDGRTTAADIAIMIGRSEVEVRAMLEHMNEDGSVELNESGEVIACHA